MARPGSPGSDLEYDYFDDDNAEDLSYSDLDAFPGTVNLEYILIL